MDEFEKTVPAFGPDDMKRWTYELRHRPPDLPPGDPDPRDVPRVRSLRTAADAYGLFLLIETTDGAQQMLSLNPVAAHALAMAVSHLGAEAGWIDAAGDVIIPQVPPEQLRRP